MDETPDSDRPSLSPILGRLARGELLSRSAADTAFERVMSGEATPSQIGALLMGLESRAEGPTVEEITGAAEAMRRHATPTPVPPGLDVVDTCGTGGDATGTFNISTAAALIAAAAGATVGKHGNRSVTSGSGSSQVLATLGVNVEATGEVLRRCLAEAGICFCYAPLHHPAMKHAAGPRKEMGIRTLFNLLGPLTNPAGARRQVVGVFDPSWVEPIAQVQLNLGATHTMVVHGDGLDELTTTAASRLAVGRGETVETAVVDPETLGLSIASLGEIQVRDDRESAEVIRAILRGATGPPRDIACLNAAAALLVADVASDLSDGLTRAREAVDSGAAAATLEKLVEISRGE